MDVADYSLFRRRLVAWYGKHARDLPWRRTADPYRIWISEIMLQQTTVVAVIPYYERFFARFPTVRDLAAADETEVLKLWEGLGYYSRARNLHRAAQAIVDERQGEFPEDVSELQSLPGIGRYTAGAIASFAFDRRAPIVEANTLRLYCRLLGFVDDPRSKSGQEALWTFAESILPKTQPGRFNQALMELGATVCSPKDPDCSRCPVFEHCRACREGTQATIPRPASRPAITEVTEAAIAIRRQGFVLLRRRTSEERWAGLWDFVRFEIPASGPASRGTDLHLIEQVRLLTGLNVTLNEQLAELKHSVTRYRITLKCFTAEAASGKLLPDQEWNWVHPSDFPNYPLSVTARQLSKRLVESLFA